MRTLLHSLFRWFAPALVLVYVVGMLAVPCLPMGDALGQAQAVPRWEFWTIHVAYPSVLWWQWTGGLQELHFLDRVPVFAMALAWLLLAWGAGRIAISFDEAPLKLSRWQTWGVSILLGHALLTALVFLIGSLLGTNWLAGSLALVTILELLAVFSIRYQIRISDPAPSEMATDRSLSHTALRRLVGMLCLGCGWLASVQVYGAAIPTHDQEVRETDVWLAKHSIDEGVLVARAESLQVNAPSPTAMTTIAIASSLEAGAGFSHDANEAWSQKQQSHIDRIVTGTIVAKVINACLVVIGIIVLGVHLLKCFGLLPSCLIVFVLLSTPGLAELVRLGRPETLLGVWASALIVVWQSANSEGHSGKSLLRATPSLTACLLLAGAFGLGYEGLVYLGIPGSCLMVWNWWSSANVSATIIKPSVRPRLSRLAMMICALAACGSVYLRNSVCLADPIYPWGSIMLHPFGKSSLSDNAQSLARAYQVPSLTVAESVRESEVGGDSESHLKNDSNRSPYRWTNLVDGLGRLLGNSTAHGLLLIPLTLLGVFTARGRVVWAQLLLPVPLFMVWVGIWWLASPRLDRGWIGAMWLLAWPAALGAKWLMDRCHWRWLVSVAGICVAWSVVVIPIWPTSDNRLLVGIESMRHQGWNAGQSAKIEDSARLDRTSFAKELNRIAKLGNELNETSKVLLVGENDDLEILCRCWGSGTFDPHPLDRLLGLSADEAFAELKRDRLTHLLFVWPGVQERALRTHIFMEQPYRKWLETMLQSGKFREVPTELDSSNAELFRVNEE